MNQYSEGLGVHASYGEDAHPDTLVTFNMDNRHCKVLEHEKNHNRTPSKTIAQWTCACGKEEFRIYAFGLSTVAQCIECNNEKEIHEG